MTSSPDQLQRLLATDLHLPSARDLSPFPFLEMGSVVVKAWFDIVAHEYSRAHPQAVDGFNLGPADRREKIPSLQEFFADQLAHTSLMRPPRGLLQEPHMFPPTAGPAVKGGTRDDPAALIDFVGRPVGTRFQHLVHYGGNFYCYVLCRVLASYIWKHGRIIADGHNAQQLTEAPPLLRLMQRGSVDASMAALLELLPRDRRGAIRSLVGLDGGTQSVAADPSLIAALVDDLNMGLG
eukprot:GHVU01020569.1.p1 GENE.GHVU01020569.1~~GHVU01020569.1.p1  ORF type:complete len:237 (+),score=32.94 GHVU01020569.1:576-1286(+)